MKIVIDYRSLLKNTFSDTYCRYIINAISHVQREKLSSEFIGIVDKKTTGKISPNGSIKLVMATKSWPGITGWKLWYHRQLPLILRKTEADVLITTGIASKNITIPQCVWIPGIGRENYLKKKYFNWIKEKTPSSLENAKIIFTNSEKTKKNLIVEYPSLHNKINVIQIAADENALPVDWTEREDLKKNYAGGKEYFLNRDPDLSVDEFMSLLKSFSQFKKRQQSNMQLVTTSIGKEKKFLEKLENFKFRQDVHVYSSDEKIDMEKLSAAAYALLLTRPVDLDILNSFKRQVPVITSRDGYPEEMDPAAVLHANFRAVDDTAAQMMLLYKDENQRNLLIEKGKEISIKWSQKLQSDQLWRGLEAAVND